MDRPSSVPESFWPFAQQVLQSWDVPGLAVCLVHDHTVVTARGVGTRDRSAARPEPVTGDTLFHLASISKSFVATATLRLVEEGLLDLDAPVTGYLPDVPWADPRAGRVTVRHLLSHRSGLGDVTDYGWHEPETDDDALTRFAARVAGWTLEQDPGEKFAYSNAAYEVLGHLVATVGGQTFEDLMTDRVLVPAGMTTSTFLRSRVPARLGATPHLGLPLRVLPGVYPYTRPHAPSSSLHSSAAELGRWMVAHLAGGSGLVSPTTHATMWRPEVTTDWEDFHEQMALGWFWGSYRGHAVVGHAGSDPGFQSNLTMIPELGIGVAVLVNANTAPVFGLTRAALDVLLGMPPGDLPPPPVTVELGPVLETEGVAAAAERYHRLAAAEPLTVDLDEEGFEECVWGLIEMHRTDLAQPLLDLWREVQPDSSQAWFMTGWAHEVDGRHQLALEHLHRAVELDPDNEEATSMLRRLPAGD